MSQVREGKKQGKKRWFPGAEGTMAQNCLKENGQGSPRMKEPVGKRRIN